MSDEKEGPKIVAYEALPDNVRTMIDKQRGKGNRGLTIGELKIDGDNFSYSGRPVVFGAEASGEKVKEVGMHIEYRDPAERNKDKSAASSKKEKPEGPDIVLPEITDSVDINALPSEVKGYIRNFLGKMDIEMDVDGKRMVIKDGKATWGGKLVTEGKAPDSVPFSGIPEWAKNEMGKNAKGIVMQDGRRIVWIGKDATIDGIAIDMNK